MVDQLLTLTELEQLSGVKRWTWYRLLRQGNCPISLRKLNSRRIVALKSEVEQWMSELPLHEKIIVQEENK
ncbi:MAG: AlpA family phage regulatory protein [Thermodesulfobacteriota bacterium]